MHLRPPVGPQALDGPADQVHPSNPQPALHPVAQGRQGPFARGAPGMYGIMTSWGRLVQYTTSRSDVSLTVIWAARRHAWLCGRICLHRGPRLLRQDGPRTQGLYQQHLGHRGEGYCIGLYGWILLDRDALPAIFRLIYMLNIFHGCGKGQGPGSFIIPRSCSEYHPC